MGQKLKKKEFSMDKKRQQQKPINPTQTPNQKQPGQRPNQPNPFSPQKNPPQQKKNPW
jgi:hypothetical protein